MTQEDDLKYLRVVLVLVGIIFLAGIYPFMIIWPSGWAWHTGHSDYPMMIVGIYATLGVFLILAARDPLAHLSLIWFTVWSSLVHGGIMALQSFEGPENHGHLLGDVPALLIVALVLAILTPRGERARTLRHAAVH
jgi:hypothetical protein